MAAGRRRSSVAASVQLQLPSASPLLLLTWIFFSCNWGHAVASFDPATASMTALQKHVSFFDANKDGIITHSETTAGFIAIGCELAFSTAAATTIHASFGPKTSPDDAPLPHLDIYIENIHKAMHGGDTGAFDAEGRFVPEKFGEIFTKYAKTKPDALTLLELQRMVLSNLDPDPTSVASQLEWDPIYMLAKDSNGFLHSDSVRGIYDGNVFTKLEEKRKNALSHV